MNPSTEALLARALARFDEENAADPRTLSVDGRERPRELVQAERLEAWIYRVSPEPSLPLRLAARSQHLARFAVPREDYPSGRVGYLSWRKDLSKMHADRAEAILLELGFDEATRRAVRTIHLKQGLKQNPDVQAMEDALCLSFLEHELASFIEPYEDEKVIEIVRKTWAKMSDRGRELALALPLTGRALTLVQEALAP